MVGLGHKTGLDGDSGCGTGPSHGLPQLRWVALPWASPPPQQRGPDVSSSVGVAPGQHPTLWCPAWLRAGAHQGNPIYFIKAVSQSPVVGVDAVGCLPCAPGFVPHKVSWFRRRPVSTVTPACENPGKGCQSRTGLCPYPQEVFKVTSTSPTISLGLLGSD